LSKAFTKDDGVDEPPLVHSRFPPLAANFRNFITAAGRAALEVELENLRSRRDESRDRDHDLKRLTQEIDILTSRLATQEVMPVLAAEPDRVMFGTTVRILDAGNAEREYTLVGVDETNVAIGQISWTSPLARALLNQPVGQIVKVSTPKGEGAVEILAVHARS